jgi:UDP-N-acetylmuramyl pentapeptide phosphotransferase/UDP-N-acetylglucosamine-1-phosphate transferase
MVFSIALAAIAIAAAIISAVGTRTLIPLLRSGRVVAVPNERSLHAVPTPAGGGAAPVSAIVLVWLALTAAGWVPGSALWVVLGTVILAAVSWADDRRGLSVGARLIPQIVVVAGSVMLGVPGGQVFQSLLPPLLDRFAAGLLWLWFLNLFNFMDGADGLAGSEAAAIGLGLALLGVAGTGHDPATAGLGVAMAAAALGFLWWNWAPARVFLGDVGSVPLGYLIGFLLLRLAAQGLWKAALILPLYFLADATITLGRRALRGEKVWQAHREHFYQRAVLAGLSHAAMVRRVVAANLVLILCAWAAENGFGVAALAAAAAVVAILLVVLARARYTGAR